MGRAIESAWLPVIAAVVLAGAFIARTAFVVNGEVFFSLFDDAMISMRFARNLAEGHGLVWNPGAPPVEGYSNFLWTLWMAALHLLRLPASKVSLLVMLSGASVIAANVVAVRRLVREIAPDARPAIAAAGWLVALDHGLAYWTLRGFETGLVALQIAVAALLAIRVAKAWSLRTLGALAAVMALGTLTRDDTVPAWLVVTAYVGVCGPRTGRRRGALLLAGAVAAALLGHVLFRMAYYGAPLPNTYYLKMYRIPAPYRWSRGLRTLAETCLFCLPVPLGVLASVPLRRPRSPGVVLLGCLFLAECACSVHVGGDAFEHELLVNRFLATVSPVLFALVAVAAHAVIADDARPPRRIWAAAACSLLVLAAAWNLHSHAVFDGAGALRFSRIAAVLAAAIVAVAVHFRGNRNHRGERSDNNDRDDNDNRGERSDNNDRGVPAAWVLVAVVLAIVAPAHVRSIIARPLWANDDALVSRYGLLLAAATREDASIAVTWAGAIPYFARRPAIDVLGKCDPVIARGPPQPVPRFSPGHVKWDIGHSLGELRPDVVAQAPVDAADLPRIEAWGYERVGPVVFVRRGAPSVDRDAVIRAACVIPWDDETMWDHFDEPLSEWRARWERECAGRD